MDFGQQRAGSGVILLWVARMPGDIKGLRQHLFQLLADLVQIFYIIVLLILTRGYISHGLLEKVEGKGRDKETSMWETGYLPHAPRPD